jgi:hypothetical protein
MTALAEALAAGPKITRGPGCTLALIVTKLDTVDRAALETALDPMSGFSGEQLATLLIDAGHHVRGHTVQRHRLGKCSCGAR